MDGAADLVSEHGVDHLVLLDARLARERGGDDGRAEVVAATGPVLDLGPFGGAEDFGPLLWPWAVVYLGLVGWAALRAFAVRDL